MGRGQLELSSKKKKGVFMAGSQREGKTIKPRSSKN